jgi:hypothetical protein
VPLIDQLAERRDSSERPASSVASGPVRAGRWSAIRGAFSSGEAAFINGHDLVVDGGLTGWHLCSAQTEGWKQMREVLATA